MKSPEELTVAFRTRGLKVTPQRQAIFVALSGNPTHPSAEAIYASVSATMPTISLRTVYQTLNDLTEMGEINSVDLGTGATRFDPNLKPHHHLVCSACGAVSDVHGSFPSIDLPEGQAEGFAVTATEIVFRGVCEACRASGSIAERREPTPGGPSGP
jgi:Fur family transcriptional regulator, stress-responsive regulator